jgi:hypothetical protein
MILLFFASKACGPSLEQQKSNVFAVERGYSDFSTHEKAEKLGLGCS